MKELIYELNKDHEQIEVFLDKMEALIHETNFSKNLHELSALAEEFEKLSLLHHAREEKILYPWMLKQNKSSDKELIERIIEDHRALEKKVGVIRSEMAAAAADQNYVYGNLGYALTILISKYKEHAERESSFIFLIAESLSDATAS